MNIFLIERYINKLTKNDIYNYSIKEGIELTNQEINIIHYYIKNYYKPFLNGHNEEIINELKEKVTTKTSNKIDELYNLYKNKFNIK